MQLGLGLTSCDLLSKVFSFVKLFRHHLSVGQFDKKLWWSGSMGDDTKKTPHFCGLMLFDLHANGGIPRLSIVTGAEELFLSPLFPHFCFPPFLSHP